MSAVLAKGIKLPTTSDKVIIHFQKKKNHGGDVDCVFFPLSEYQPDTALVIFDEKEVADSVIKFKQVFQGETLSVTKESQVFDILKVSIKKSTIQSQKKNVDKFAKDIKSKFSCIELDLTSDSIEIQTKYWSVLDILHQKIEKLLDPKSSIQKGDDHKVTVTSTSDQDFLKSNLESMNLKLETAQNIKEEYMETGYEESMPGTSGLNKRKTNNQDLENSVSFLLDSDVLAYILEFQKHSVKKIENELNVIFTLEGEHKEYTTVTCTPRNSTKSQACRGKDELNNLFEETQNLDTFKHEVHLDANFDPQDFHRCMSFRAAFNCIGMGFPRDFIFYRMTDDGVNAPWVSFISDDDKKIENAISWFEFMRAEFMRFKPVKTDCFKLGYLKKVKEHIIIRMEQYMSAELFEVVKNKGEVAVFLKWNKMDEQMSFDVKNEKMKTVHDFFNNVNLVYHSRSVSSDASIEAINKSNANIFACRSGISRCTFVTEVAREKELEKLLNNKLRF